MKFTSEIDKAWTTDIPGIHDNGPRDQALWRLTLTAYCQVKFLHPPPPYNILLFQFISYDLANHWVCM